ncbi:MAG: cytidylate kinase-like family protein [Candidatus Zixiibacteriota bacterium]|nr:MAG: cytidylate kinase-like family protein [candidate division Zixibacteria bacterium]
MGSIEALIDRQLRKWELEKRMRLEAEKEGKEANARPIVTVSRQRGSQGSYLAEKLAVKFGYQLLHREIIDEICHSSGYRRQIIESLDDKVRSRMELWFEGIFKGMFIDSSDYFKHLYKVIMTISELGGVVVVGRGANFMLPYDQGFHIRVVAAIPKRVENLVKFQNLTQKQAEKEVRELDRSRSEFVKSGFRQDINDPRAYDMVINTTYIDIEDAVTLAEMGMRAKVRMSGNDWAGL